MRQSLLQKSRVYSQRDISNNEHKLWSLIQSEIRLQLDHIEKKQKTKNQTTDIFIRERIVSKNEMPLYCIIVKLFTNTFYVGLNVGLCQFSLYIFSRQCITVIPPSLTTQTEAHTYTLALDYEFFGVCIS